MDASKLNALLTANGGWTKVVYISLNNGKQLLVTEDMKTGPDAIRIDGEFIRIKNDRYFANGMNDFLPRQVIEFHAIEFVECVYFAQNDESLLKPTSYAEFTTDRNFDIADTIEDKTHQASIRVSHPNLEVKSGGTLTKEYEITMSGTVTRIKLSGRNEQLKMDEAITNMYALPFDREALVIERVESTTEALFDIKAYRKGTHEILVRIGSQELYFKVVVGDDATLTVKQPVTTMLMAEESTVEENVTEPVVKENKESVEEESIEPVMMMSLEEEVTEENEESINEEEIVVEPTITETAEEPVVSDQVETTEEEKQETVIVLGFSTKTLANGKTFQMEVLVEPEQSVTFVSSNESVATVSETGLITVVADSGQSTIKVIAADGTTNSVVIKAKAAQ